MHVVSVLLTRSPYREEKDEGLPADLLCFIENLFFSAKIKFLSLIIIFVN